jgi:hypothetical protein
VILHDLIYTLYLTSTVTGITGHINQIPRLIISRSTIHLFLDHSAHHC